MTTYHKIDAPFLRDKKGVLQQGLWCRPEFEYLANNPWEFTEKVDGTNIRLYFHRWQDWIEFEIKGRSDNAQVPTPLLTVLTELCTKVQDSIALIMIERDINQLVVYGEGYGPKINGGDKYTDAPDFVVFDVKVGDFWLDRANVNDFCDKVGLDKVPVYGVGSLYDGFNLVMLGAVQTRFGTTIDHAISLSGGNALKSHWGDFEAEGIVAVPTVPLFNRAGNRIITKIKSKDFR